MSDKEVNELEKAIIKRAEILAKEYDDRATQARNEILHEAHERLSLREDREVQISKQLAERDYARRIQANELKYQRKLDILRWNLVQTVVTQLHERLRLLAEEHSDEYQHLLGILIQNASNSIDSDELIAYVNSSDHKRLGPQWETFVSQYAGNKNIILSNEPIDCIGGVLITNMYDDIRVDNRLEGRMERMTETLNQLIMERLFSSVEQLGSLHIS